MGSYFPVGSQFHSQSPLFPGLASRQMELPSGTPFQGLGVHLLFYLTHSSHFKGMEMMTRTVFISSHYWGHRPPLWASAQCNPRFSLPLPLNVERFWGTKGPSGPMT